jgi:hypothetical protein
MKVSPFERSQRQKGNECNAHAHAYAHVTGELCSLWFLNVFCYYYLEYYIPPPSPIGVSRLTMKTRLKRKPEAVM